MTEEPKPQRLRALPRALVFAALLPQLQAVAREYGYALTVHGSMATDLDLVAVPWVDEAAPPSKLLEAIRTAVDGLLVGKPSQKPHGRRAWSIHPKVYTPVLRDVWEPYIDLSVMPRRRKRKAGA